MGTARPPLLVKGISRSLTTSLWFEPVGDLLDALLAGIRLPDPNNRAASRRSGSSGEQLACPADEVRVRLRKDLPRRVTPPTAAVQPHV